MPVKGSQIRASNAPANLSGQSDVELLDLIAGTKDRDAYAELYQRHNRATYNLAFHLCREKEQALEACQEAWLRIWKNAGAYRPTSGVRNWILSITANATLTLLSRKQRLRKRSAPAEVLESLPSAEDQRSDDHDELLAGLNAGILTLPDQSRKLLSLYYGAGMSQTEIGKMMSMPQRTVSMRIEQALSHLRTILGKAGFAATPALFSHPMLSEAFISGPEAPAELAEAVMHNIPAHEPSTLTTGKLLLHPATLATTLVILMTGTLIWNSATKTPTEVAIEKTKTQNAPTRPKNDRPLNTITNEKVDLTWKFNSKEDLHDFIPMMGNQRLQVDESGEGMDEEHADGRLRLEPNMVLLFKHQLPDLPLMLTVRLRLAVPLGRNEVKRYTVGAGWNNVRHGVFTSRREHRFRTPEFIGPWEIRTFYITKNHTQGIYRGVRGNVSIFEQEKPGQLWIGVCHNPVFIDCMTLKSIPETQVPDYSPYLQKYLSFPPQDRVGKVSISPPDPKEPFFLPTGIQFISP